MPVDFDRSTYGRRRGHADEARAVLIAALFVAKGGCYFGLPNVDPWDELRDARLYGGPHPVVAHPPCERWGRYWSGGPSARVRRIKGDDNGCFAAALASVRRWGGVLEHPEASSAWRAHGLNSPPRHGGWVSADFEGGWTCCVEQGHYGHAARKATWLYAIGVGLPSMAWGKSAATMRLDEWFHSAEERRRATKTGICQRLSKNQRAATPPAFRDLLISIAESADMANRPPAITGGTQANQWQADGSMRRTLRPQGETTRSGSPSSQAAWAMPRCPK